MRKIRQKKEKKEENKIMERTCYKIKEQKEK